MEKSKILSKVLESRTGTYVSGESEIEQELWKRLGSMSNDLKINYADNKIYSISIAKIGGYDFLEDIYEELYFLEYLFKQCEDLESTDINFKFKSKEPSTEFAEYLEYHSEKYKEISIKRTNYVGGGLLSIKININPLKKIYKRLSFVNGGERMETTVTNNIDASDSNVLIGENVHIKNSFNNLEIKTIPQNIVDEINSVKNELLKCGVSEGEINDLIQNPTADKINSFNNKLLPFLSNFASFTTIVSGLAQLIN